MRRRLIALLAILALVAAACASGASSDETEAGFAFDAPDSTESPAATEAAVEGFAGGAAPADEVERLSLGDKATDGESLSTSGGVDAAPIASLNRDIIYEAWVAVAVEDVGDASREAVDVMQSLGGFVFGQETTGAPNPRTTLIFKIDPDGFGQALEALAGIGELRSQVISADDVTERVVDLESRIATSEVSVERLRELLSKATDTKAIADLESQLLQRETTLESMRGQLRTLQDAVRLATITLTITEAFSAPDLRVSVSAYPGVDAEGASCPGDDFLRVDEGTDVTVCFELVNNGDTLLGDFELRDAVLDIELDDLTVVFGDLDRPIEPGETVMLATSIRLERSLQTRARVSAVPRNVDGEVLEGRAISQTVGMQLRADEVAELPGFLDGFQGSLRVLVQMWQGLLLGLGAGLPFLVVVGIGWLIFRSMRSRRHPEAVSPGSDEEE